MTKRAKKPKTRRHPQPEPAQLKAIERLIETEDYAQAARKLRTLISQFPDHSGLRRNLVETLDYDQRPREAALAAFQWTERRPNSPAALEALMFFSLKGGHIFLADRTSQRLRELGAETPGFPVADDAKKELAALPDGTTATDAEMEHFDIGKLLLDGQDFAGAQRWLDGVSILPARNNRALALFHQCRTDDALQAFIQCWEADPDNLLALGWAAQLRLYQGDTDGARGLTTPLGTAVARRLDDGLSQLSALLLLREDDLAREAFDRGQQAYWSTESDPSSIALWHHFGACAYCRLGEEETARKLWRTALDNSTELAAAQQSTYALQTGEGRLTTPMVLEIHHLLPLEWIKRVRNKSLDLSKSVTALDASNAYLEAAYYSGDEVVRKLVTVLSRFRAEHGDEDAVQTLKLFARLPIGTNEDRFGLLAFLQDNKLVRPDEHFEYWDGKELRTIKTLGTEIHRDPKPTGLPPDLEPLLPEFIEFYHAERLREAEACLSKILERFPDHPTALGNLAGVRSKEGKNDEALQLLHRTVEKNPDYLFGRCNLARELVFRGEVEEAKALLDGQVEQERLHIQEAFALYGTLALLNRAQGEEDAAKALLTTLEGMVEDEDDERYFKEAQRLVERYDSVH